MANAAGAAGLPNAPAANTPQAEPPFTLVFDLDDTIAFSLPDTIWAELGSVQIIGKELRDKLRPYLLTPIVDLLLKAAQLRETGIVKYIFMLTNNSYRPYISAIDLLLFEIARETLGDGVIPVREPFPDKRNTPLISSPLFFDAILTREDGFYRNPKLGDWIQNHPKIVYMPTKSITDVYTLTRFRDPTVTSASELVPHTLFFDDIPTHVIKDEIPSNQYIVIPRLTREQRSARNAAVKEGLFAALRAELDAKFPAELALDVQEGGRRRRRSRRGTRRRVRVRRSCRARTAKVYRRRR